MRLDERTQKFIPTLPLMRKKILIITERFFPEEFLINDLAAQWKSDGVDVEVLTQVPSYPFDKVYDGYQNRFYGTTDFNGMKVHRIWTLIGYKKNVFLKILNYIHFAFWGSFAALCISKKFENIFVFQTGPLTMAIPAVMVKIFRRKKITIWTQDVWPDSVYAYGFKKTPLKIFLLDHFVSWVYRHTDNILVSCMGFSDVIKKYVHGRNISYFPNWPIVYFDSGERAVKNKTIEFTFAGNIGKVQNLEIILRAFSRVRTNSDVVLNIVGDGSNLDVLKKIVSDESIPNVKFWGRQPVSSMPQIYAQSAYLIISLINAPIFALTVPSKLQTYLVARKPVFCIMNGEVAKIVKDNNIGLVAPPDDIAKITQGFEALIRLNSKTYSTFASNMGNLLVRDYDRSKVIAALSHIIFAD